MNVDIINVLNDAFKACNMLSKSQLFEGLDNTFDEILKYDLISFINDISISNADERIFNFSMEYFNEPNVKKLNIYSPVKSVSLPFFVTLDSKTNSTTCKTLITLFMTIGKYFIFSKFDKNDIDRDKFTNYISEMNNYVVSNINNKKIEMINQNNHLEIKDITVLEQNLQNKIVSEIEDEKSLQELLDDFNSLIGLEKVKIEVRKRINQIQVDKRRKLAGFKTSPISLHLVFTGNPGTGKTTVARKLAKIYKQLGVLSKGQLIEVDRSGLVGSYVGSTALKTQEIIDKAIGGILFVDEAYTLAKDGNDFGQEAIDTLLKAMEDKRDDLVVIVAGYTNEMNTFIKSNPGLESRFNKYIEFDDYTAEELLEIFKLICKNDDKYIHDECKLYLMSHFNQMIATKSSNFANGRTVRNYYEKVVENLNERLIVNLDQIKDDELQVIRLPDLNTDI